MAFPLNETLVRGDDHPLEFSFYDKADDGTLTPIDLTLFTWFYTVKQNLTDLDADALVALDTADMDIDADPDLTRNPTGVTNRLSFWIPNASTILLPIANLHQDLQSVETASGRVQTRGLGTLTVVDDVTDRVV